MTEITNAEIVASVTTATRDVFSTMLALECEPQPARQEEGEPAPVDGVIALVGIGGSWTGSGRICCSPALACKLAGALLCAEYESVDEDVLDAMAEVANMIIGNVKTNFEETLGPLGLSVPTVIFGRNYQARSSGVRGWTVTPFKIGEDVMDVRFCLMPSRTPTMTSHHQNETVHA